MEYNQDNIFYAEEGKYVTLSDLPYRGFFHKMPSGALMTGKQHGPDSEVIVEADRKTELTELENETSLNTDLNENDTDYDLLPVLANKPPVITTPISEASTPRILPSSAAGTVEKGKFMFQFPDGTIKVHTETTIVLRIEAEQPDIFNVENGILKVIPPNTRLQYRWTVDGESIPSEDLIPELRASRVVDGNTLTITNMCPQYAGTYGVIVSNDIGPTDGGSATLEVFNSDVDSFFYTNLIQNPNGTIDGELSTDNWNTVGGDLFSKRIDPTTDGARDKRIAIDPMNPDFRWTYEMLNPRTYQLKGGSLQDNPINNLTSYFTKPNHDYTLNGGSTAMSAYQDIDVSDIHNHINGSVYGINGVRAVVSFYLGMAIHNYRPTSTYMLPNDIADISNYNKREPRVGFDNFFLMGGGEVQETLFVDIQEYHNETPLLSLDRGGKARVKLKRSIDPWNKRLNNYNGQKFTDTLDDDSINFSWDESVGDERDRHLFVMRELQKHKADRYAYGQYAEFNKIVIPFLNPKTTKIRISLTIETKGSLEYVQQLTKLGLPVDQLSGGVFSFPGWAATYERSQPSRKSNEPKEERQQYYAIKEGYRATDGEGNEAPWPASIGSRLPRSPLSKAFASGFNLALIPYDSTKKDQVEAAVENMFAKNNRVQGLVKGPIADLRNQSSTITEGIDVTFGMIAGINGEPKINVMVETYKNSRPNQTRDTEQYVPGLFPFLPSSETVLPVAPKIVTSANLITDPKGGLFNGMSPTNGIASPMYAIPNDSSGFRYTQLHDKDLYKGRVTSTTIAPKFPITWYTLRDEDKLAVYNSGSVPDYTKQKYKHWAVPGSELDYTTYIDKWNSDLFGEFFKPEMQEQTQDWQQESRFILTIGVHNTNEDLGSPDSLYMIDNYYLDMKADEAIIHKTPNLGGVLRLPSFDKTEYPTQSEIDALASPTASILFGVQGLTPENNESVAGAQVYGLRDSTMRPIVVDIEKVAGSALSTARIPLPDIFLKRLRSEGGLGIPIIDISGSLELDPSYKVCLYGVRPAPQAQRLRGFDTAQTGDDVIYTQEFIGTPLRGDDASRNVEYVVNNIKVVKGEMTSEADSSNLDYGPATINR